MAKLENADTFKYWASTRRFRTDANYLHYRHFEGLTMPLSFNAKKHYTYGDYVKWPADERWELIGGAAYCMSPAPNTARQTVSGKLYTQISLFLRGNPCRVIAAPFDVRLPAATESDEKVDTVVQPDIAVICDPTKIDEKGCRGAPDWIIEILSPHTASHDQVRKLALYEQHGVKEYWIAHPIDRIVTILLLEPDGEFGRSCFLEATGTTAARVIPELEVDWSLVFDRLDG